MTQGDGTRLDHIVTHPAEADPPVRIAISLVAPSRWRRAFRVSARSE